MAKHIVTQYIHASKGYLEEQGQIIPGPYGRERVDAYLKSHWQDDDATAVPITPEAYDNLRGLGYEVKLDWEVDTITGEARIVTVDDREVI